MRGTTYKKQGRIISKEGTADTDYGKSRRRRFEQIKHKLNLKKLLYLLYYACDSRKDAGAKAHYSKLARIDQIG